MARATTRIGLIATLSSTYREPFDVARLAATLDLASGGRAGINVVTSGSDGAAALSGELRGRLPDRDTLYGRADEFLTAVEPLWDSWEPGALVADPATGVIVDDSLAPPLEFTGEHIGLTARFQFPRSVQGRPAIVQAGGSRRASSWPPSTPTRCSARPTRSRPVRSFTALSRIVPPLTAATPDEILVLPGLNITLGGTEAEADGTPG